VLKVKEQPKTRWKTFPKTKTETVSEISKSPGQRLDATFYIAKECLMKILGELRHDTLPSLEEFMAAIDFVLDHPKLMKAAIENL